MRSAVLSLALVVAACGGRLDGGAAAHGDAAPADDSVACGDAGACPASAQFCREVLADAGLVYGCVALPHACHACDCASPPTPGQLCTCTSDGDEIFVSCRPF